MPYKSNRQRRFMHAAAERGDIKKSVVDEFDQASKGKKLPEKAPEKPRRKPRNLMGGFAYIVWMLAGCAALSDAKDPDWVQIRQNANQMRQDVNAAVDAVAPLAQLVMVTCQVRPDSKECSALEDAYDVAGAAIRTARRVIDLYDQTAMGAESVERAVQNVHATVLQVAAAANDAMEAINAAADHGDSGPGDAGAFDPEAGAEAPAEDTRSPAPTGAP